jgi:putative CocE/NonD family hydrolase
MRFPLYFLACGLFFTLHAQGLEYVKAHYTKYEYEIAMRDGKKLFTSVYLPKDPAEKYPILLNRTPYSVAPYGVDNYKADLGPNPEFAKQGFIFVYQDVRGRNMSEGTFVNMTPHVPRKNGKADIDESTDTYDTIDWLVKNLPNNNGKVGQYGISYPGFYTAAGMIDAHPALKASSPQAPISDWFVGDDFHHNGAFYLPHAFRFFNGFGRPRPEPTRPPANRAADVLGPDGYRFFLDMGPLSTANEKYFKNDVAFWNDIAKHPNYDQFWQSRNLRPHIKNVKHAVMTVGGWFDAENLFGALKVYESNEKNSPGAFNMLVMGPWFHGGWARGDGDLLGHVKFGSKTSLYYREKIELPFFNHYLKDKADPKLPEAYVFETGTNVWRMEDKWPPRNAQAATLYFHSNGKLSFDAPTAAGNDEYLADPMKPVPFISGQAPGMTREHMVDDQRHAAARPDVLVYQSDVLDADVTIAGPLHPKLFVSTTGTDADFVVKLVDVYPDDYPDPDPNPTGIRMAGYQQLIRGEIFRARFRKAFDKPEPMTPGKVETIDYQMPDIMHTFRKGHRIMVQVQSSWFPLADRNPQKYVENIFDAKQSDFIKATQKVYFGGSQASQVQVLVRR